MATTSSNKSTVTSDQLRRIALDAQGLTRAAPFGRGPGATHRALEQLGYIQIDTISVVARAHHHTLWNRVPNYQPLHLDRLVRDRRAFEYWFHAAAYLPMRDFRFALPRMHALKNGERHWFEKDRKLMRRIVDRIRSEGPLMARDFESPTGRKEGWWDWKPAKRALEQLYMQGDLMISARDGFQKVYDLTERVLPPGIGTSAPSADEFAGYLLETAVRAHGFASAKEITYLRRGAAIRRALRARLNALVSDGALVVVRNNGADYYADPDLLDRATPRTPARVRLLSPFDNAVIQRDRNVALHDYDYQIECYVPAPKRRFGYFCLPILYRDRFVGRVDCKAHRKQRRLDLAHLHIERDIRDGEQFSAAFAEAARNFAAFNDCAVVNLVKVSPRRWDHEVRKALRAGV
jgi:uncharacterized protein YcaQ